jgi:L-aspartate oxidase
LASNSLLEGLVVGSRAARAVAADRAAGLLGDPRKAELLGSLAAAVTERDVLQRTMSRHAAIGRTTEGLATAAAVLEKSTVVRPLGTRESVEDAALTMAAEILLAVAAERTESRGCHVRTDYPSRNDGVWQRSIPVRLDVAGRPFLFGRPVLGGVA